MKKLRIITFITALILLISTVCANASTSFTDVNLDLENIAERKWYSKPIKYAVSYGLMNGTDDDTFEPQGSMTRGMFVTTLYRLANIPDYTANNPFTDVENNRYYTKAICWAADTGIVRGVSETEFEPNSPITREQMACIIDRYITTNKIDFTNSLFKSMWYDMTLPEYTDVFNDSFNDIDSISDYALSSMINVAKSAIFIGDKNGNLNPKNSITRAEAATVFVRISSAIQVIDCKNYLRTYDLYDGTFYVIKMSDDHADEFLSLALSTEWERASAVIDTLDDYEIITNGKRYGIVLMTNRYGEDFCYLRKYDENGQKSDYTSIGTRTNEKMLELINKLTTDTLAIPEVS